MSHFVPHHTPTVKLAVLVLQVYIFKKFNAKIAKENCAKAAKLERGWKKAKSDTKVLSNMIGPKTIWL